MDFEECQGFVQEVFMALDVMETEEQEDEAAKEGKKDFGQDNE